MKHFITLAFVTTSLLSFGQTNMFWNNYSTFNPAMSGFEHQYHSALTASDLMHWNNGMEGLNANYNQRIAHNHGVGVSYSGNYFKDFYRTNDVQLNYNYQFDLKKAGKIAPGIGFGYRNLFFDEAYYSSYFPTASSPQSINFGFVNFGVAYSWKNLVAGVSTTELTYLLSGNDFLGMNVGIGVNLHASYDFRLGRNFQLKPRALYTVHNGYQNLTMDLTATYLNKFSFGVFSSGRNNIGVHTGWDIREKFRVSYGISKSYSALTGISGPGALTHQLTLGFFLKEAKPKELR